VRAYQGLTGTEVAARIPYVLPRYQYSLTSEPDALGGRATVDVGAFNVVRDLGTNTQRVSLGANWERPFNGAYGDLWKLVLHADSAAYSVRGLDQEPSWGPTNAADHAQGMPTAALELHWPFQRDAGAWGTQLVEPIAQLIAAPNGSSYSVAGASGALHGSSLIPNEDSLDYEFTDASLFSLNRFYGIDRLEGGMRANVALHAAWFFPNGQQVDGLIGQGYRTHTDAAFPVASGLSGTSTDVVSHLTYMPNSWFDISTRERFDHNNFAVKFADVLASGGPSWLRLTGGFLHDSTNPFAYYDAAPTGVVDATPRNEVSIGAATTYGHWRLHGALRRDVQTDKMVSAALGGGYEDDCYIFDVEFNRRYTSLNGDSGDSTLLFQMTFKTVGTFGFNGL